MGRYAGRLPEVSLSLASNDSINLLLHDIAWVGESLRFFVAAGPSSLVQSFKRVLKEAEFLPARFPDYRSFDVPKGFRTKVATLAGHRGVSVIVGYVPAIEEYVKESTSGFAVNVDMATAVFRRLDRARTTPLLPEWQESVLAALLLKGAVKPWESWSWDDSMPQGFDLTIDDDGLDEVVSSLLKSKAISVPPGQPADDVDVRGFADKSTAYFRTFAKPLAEKMQQDAAARHVPGDPVPEVLSHLHRDLYVAQADVATAISKANADERAMMLVGEQGTGKTTIALALNVLHGGRGRMLAFVPGHLLNKWEREAYAVLPGIKVRRIRNLTDAIRAVPELEQAPTGPEVWLLGRDAAKLSHYWRPAVVPIARRTDYYRRHLMVAPNQPTLLTCPSCGAIVTKTIKEKKQAIEVPLSMEDFQNRGQRNSWCPKCHESLWTADGPHRASIARYWQRAFRGRKTPFDFMVFDEAHEEKNDTAQGRALARLSMLARYVLLQSGTLIGGKASDLFFLLFRANPARMKALGFEYDSPMAFVERYGRRSWGVKVLEDGGRSGEGSATRRVVREAPGIHPAIYGDLLMPATVFLDLEDIGVDLPPYEESVGLIPMHPQQAAIVEEAKKTAAEMVQRQLALKGSKTHYSKAFSLNRLLQFMLALPDRVWSSEPVAIGDGLVVWDGHLSVPESMILPKEQWLLDEVKAERLKGRRVVVYVEYTGRYDVSVRLGKILSRAGYRVSRLTAAVPKEQREAWLMDRVQHGVDVVLMHPRLIGTGLDFTGEMNFPAIKWFQTGYGVNELRQASRRAWRIGQDQPCTVSYGAYAETLQETALRLMGDKLAAANAIEGRFGEDGLLSLGMGKDVALQLARALYEDLDGLVDLKDVWRVTTGDGAKIALATPASPVVAPTLPVIAAGTITPVTAPSTAATIATAVPASAAAAASSGSTTASGEGGPTIVRGHSALTLMPAAKPKPHLTAAAQRRLEESRRLYGDGLFGWEEVLGG